jgi:dTDP-glucose 4,6-dehydratase
MAKKAVISGSNGFLGKHLWDYLASHDIEPIALSREELYIEVPALTEVLFHHKPNYIFALHSYGNHGHQKDPTQAIMANYFATMNLLKASEFLEYEAFINVATSSIYGKKEVPMSEDTSMKPDTFYAATKAGGVHLARAFAMQYDKPICSVVPFSVYGEREASFRFIPTLIKHLVTSEKMSVVLPPQHDWIYVSDYINGVMNVLHAIDKLKGETVNIGTGIATTNKEIIHLMCEISGEHLYEMPDYQEQPHHSPVWVADNAKLRSLGWQQKVSLKQGLTKCWEYYSKLYT